MESLRRTAGFFFIIALLLSNWVDSSAPPAPPASDVLYELREELHRMKSLIVQLERKEATQQLQIDQLTTSGAEMDKLVRQLLSQQKLQASREESLVVNNKSIIIGPQASAADGSDGGPGSKAIAMPTSCGELSLYGYTLPGFYLIKGPGGTLDTVFCDFSAGFGQTGYQTLIGYNDIKTSSVHFYVQRNQDKNDNGAIPYEITILNEGGGMNAGTGVFTAPVAGIYHFSFSARTSTALDVTLNYCSSGSCGVARSRGAAVGDMTPLRATLRMKKGDYVYVSNDNGHLEDSTNGGQYTQFTGFLLEQDLDF